MISYLSHTSYKVPHFKKADEFLSSSEWMGWSWLLFRGMFPLLLSPTGRYLVLGDKYWFIGSRSSQVVPGIIVTFSFFFPCSWPLCTWYLFCAYGPVYSVPLLVVAQGIVLDIRYQLAPSISYGARSATRLE